MSVSILYLKVLSLITTASQSSEDLIRLAVPRLLSCGCSSTVSGWLNDVSFLFNVFVLVDAIGRPPSFGLTHALSFNLCSALFQPCVLGIPVSLKSLVASFVSDGQHET